MAIVENNDLTRGLRGRVGKWLVFRMVRGKTIASHAPRKPDPRKQSAAQRLTRSTFRDASAWAVRILMDPVKKQYYADIAKAQALPNAYTAAVREYMQRVTAKTTENQLDYPVSTNKEANDDKKGGSTSSSPPQHIPSERSIQNVKRHRLRLSKDICCSHYRTTIKSVNVWPEIDKIERVLQLSSKQKFPADMKHGHFKPTGLLNQSRVISHTSGRSKMREILPGTSVNINMRRFEPNSARVRWSGLTVSEVKIGNREPVTRTIREAAPLTITGELSTLNLIWTSFPRNAALQMNRTPQSGIWNQQTEIATHSAISLLVC